MKRIKIILTYNFINYKYRLYHIYVLIMYVGKDDDYEENIDFSISNPLINRMQCAKFK